MNLHTKLQATFHKCHKRIVWLVQPRVLIVDCTKMSLFSVDIGCTRRRSNRNRLILIQKNRDKIRQFQCNTWNIKIYARLRHKSNQQSNNYEGKTNLNVLRLLTHLRTIRLVQAKENLQTLQCVLPPQVQRRLDSLEC